jgi:hypothetical protein
MAIGGFASLVVVALWRQLGLPAFPMPEWLVVDGTLRVRTISQLSVLKSANLILSQAVIAVLGGYTLGTVKYVWYDERRQTHSNLEHPWTQLTDEIPNEPITIVSNDGTYTKGRPIALGSKEQAYDIMLVASGPEASAETADYSPDESSADASLPRGAISYHQYDDISRVVVPGSREDTNNRTVLQERHALFAEDLVENGLQSVVRRKASLIVVHIESTLYFFQVRIKILTMSVFKGRQDNESEGSNADNRDDSGTTEINLLTSDDE